MKIQIVAGFDENGLNPVVLHCSHDPAAAKQAYSDARDAGKFAKIGFYKNPVVTSRCKCVVAAIEESKPEGGGKGESLSSEAETALARAQAKVVALKGAPVVKPDAKAASAVASLILG